jgi:hypothetical protein
MQIDIQEKLRQLLTDKLIDDEMKVAYLLVECRKLLEHDQTLEDNSPTLEFYLNWGLHTQLSRAGARAFLTKVNPLLVFNGVFDNNQHHALNALLTLDAFRLELRSLLASFNADLALCDDPARWTTFVHLYSHLVQDSELLLEQVPQPSGPLLLAVKKVTISPVVGDPLADPSVRVYPMTWFIEYADGRAGRLELSQHGLAGARVTLLGPTLESVSAIHRAQSQIH